MEKITEYKIVDGHTAEELADAVNKLISEGFEPFGDTLLIESEHRLYQPMVKKVLDRTPAQFR